MTPVDYVRIFTQAINRYGELGEQTSHRLEGMMQTQIQERRYAQYLLLAGLFAVALLAILLAVMITRSVTRPVKEAVEVASRVAAGDLTAQLNVSGSNEMAELLNALMRMQQRLAQLVSDIKGNAATIANSSEEIARGNGDCRRAPSNRRLHWLKRLPAWSSWRQSFSRTRITRALPLPVQNLPRRLHSPVVQQWIR